jgi:signal transduction histidine kinase
MMRWPRPRTFRASLTVWWTAGFALLLAAACVAVYLAFARYLDRDLDLKVRTVAATELASSTDGATVHLHELPTDALARGAYTEKFVQIFDAHGRLHLSSRSLAGAPALIPASVIEAALAGEAPVVSVTIGGRPARAAVLRTRMGAEGFAVLVGVSRDQIDAHLARLAWVLLTVWGAGVAATSALGYWLASRALAPVVDITSRAARIAQGEFAVRLAPSRQDEVGQMTESLNHVLDRLHGAIEAHRRFAADASHELRAPLTAMAGEVDVMLKYRRTADEYRETLVIVSERLAALTSLCEDLMLLVHAQEGAHGIELREVPVWRHLKDAASRLAGDPSRRAITIAARELPDLVAYADPRLLARVFDNVLSNAMHYNRDGGTIVISGSAEESPPDEWKTGAIVITVTDSGHGIPAAEWERVFDRFYRLDQSRTRRTGGSGLGLAICREVMTVLGGSIRIISSSNAGTTFEIKMPGRLASADLMSHTIASRLVADRHAMTPESPAVRDAEGDEMVTDPRERYAEPIRPPSSVLDVT